jgi:hypothetical protein
MPTPTMSDISKVFSVKVEFFVITLDFIDFSISKISSYKIYNFTALYTIIFLYLLGFWCYLEDCLYCFRYIIYLYYIDFIEIYRYIEYNYIDFLN